MVVIDTNQAEDGLYAGLVARLGRDVVKRERLDLGDVKFDCSEGSILVERKTWNDWAASISDGRYKEQKARFIRSKISDAERLIYLIEGNLVSFSGKTHGILNKALNAALLKTDLRDRISVIRSTGNASSIDILEYVYQQFALGNLNTDAAGGAVGFAGSAKKRKRDNLDAQATYVEMLTTIPGVSSKKARSIAQVVPSLSNLCKTDVNTLATIDCNGRALGKALASRIYAVTRA